MNANRRLLGYEMIPCMGDLLSDIVENFYGSSYVREAHTRKHVLANECLIKRCGAHSLSDLIGVTPDEFWIEDITHRNNRLSLDSDVLLSERNCVKAIEALEDQVLFNRFPISLHRTLLKFDGLVKFDKLTIMPVSGRSNKRILALLTFFYNLTHCLSLQALFQLYQGYYQKKKAVQKTLEHFGLDQFFNHHDLPTCAELQVLFAMREDSRYKAVARKLNISVVTATNHISRIQEKILNPFTLHGILLKLRIIPLGYEHEPVQNIRPL